MFVSLNWIKEFVDLPDSVSAHEVAQKLNLSTVEVEGIEYFGSLLENVVVGKVVSTEKHPNADRLKVCIVDAGNEQVQVVCGGSNVAVDMKVALAKIGAKVQWHGEGDLIELEKTKIRGVSSEGMICASTEIGLSQLYPLKDEKEILDLSSVEAEVGTPLTTALSLNDSVFDIDNKSMSHRQDLWGHYGMAREVAALFRKKVKKYEVPAIKDGSGYMVDVKVEDKKKCPRYMAVVIDGIEVKASPEWLQRKLISVGLRPINNIVDITNLVLHELGQPMHAFDWENIDGDEKNKKIFVRKSDEDEGITALDGTEIDLESGSLLIADKTKPLALAGVIGGLNSEIENDTTTILFESANFCASSVRRSSMKYGIRTDSSTRFEKSLDPTNAETAMKRAVQLTLELCPNAKVSSKLVDMSDFSIARGPIVLSLLSVEKKLGVKIEKKQIIGILERLGFEIKDKKDKLMVTIPTWRATKDIQIQEDLIEEIVRFYGYDNIESSLPKFPIIPPQQNHLRVLERKLKNLLALNFGFSETYNYSFVSGEWLSKMGINIDSHLELDNPIAKDRPLLRTSLVPELVQNIESNHYTNEELRLFEIGSIYDADIPGERTAKNSDELLPRQDLMLGLVYSGKTEDVPFFEISDAIKGVLSRLGFDISIRKAEQNNARYHHPARQADVFVGDNKIGNISELHPSVQNKLGIAHRVAFGQLNVEELLKYYSGKKEYKPLAHYPAVERDVAFVVDAQVEHAQIQKSLSDFDKLIESVELFDVYKGKNMQEGKKSMAYHIIYRSNDCTLKTEDVDKVHAQVVTGLKSQFGAEIRA